MERKRNILLTALLLFSISLFLVNSIPLGIAQTGTNVNGIISQDNTWTKAGSPYILNGPVAVNQGVTLKIEPGVTIDTFGFYLQVNGTVIMLGTDSNQINFTGSLILTSLCTNYNSQTGVGSVIEHTNIQGRATIMNSPKISQNKIVTLECYSSSSIISENQIQVLFISKGSPTIENNNIAEIYNGAGSDWYSSLGLNQLFEGGSPIISNNYVSGLYDYAGTNAIIQNNTVSSSMKFVDSNKPTIENNHVGQQISFSGLSPTITNNKINFPGNFTIDLNPLVVDYSGSAIISNNRIYGNYYTYRSGKYDEVNVTVATTGIRVSGENNAYISNNIISGGGDGIFFDVTRGDDEIVGNTIYGGQGNGIVVSSEANLIIKENIIDNYTVYGVSIQDSQAIIQNNTIRNNSGGGILLLANVLVNYNNIQNNGNASIFLSTSSNINAQFNWWGTTDQQAINQTIYDFKNDFNLGKVNFTPSLTAPNSQAMPNQTTLLSPSNSPSPTPMSAVTELSWLVVLVSIVLVVAVTVLTIRRHRKTVYNGDKQRKD